MGPDVRQPACGRLRLAYGEPPPPALHSTTTQLFPSTIEVNRLFGAFSDTGDRTGWSQKGVIVGNSSFGRGVSRRLNFGRETVGAEEGRESARFDFEMDSNVEKNCLTGNPFDFPSNSGSE